jgi:hypothetical protein
MKEPRMANSLPPGSFEETMNVPEAGYRTAIAIKHPGRMTEVTVTFTLREQVGNSATYAGLCPRCKTGEIVVAVKLDPDGRFAEPPACPMLCMDCEDRLDAVLEPQPGLSLADEPGNRATLGKYLKAMSLRSWE